MFENFYPRDSEFYLDELERCKKRLYLDPSTNFLNRNGFMERFSTIFEREPNCAAIAIFVENLEEIERNYGHQVSHYYLKYLANKIKIILRKALINAHLARNLFLSIVSYQEASWVKELALKIKYYLQGPFTYRGAYFPMKVKVCVCFLPRDCDPQILTTLICKSFSDLPDQELSVIDYFSEKQRLSRNLPFYLHLSRKIIMGEVGFALQPIQEVATGKISLYEVLARIPTKADRLIHAADFMQRVEELSLKKDLERTIVYKTLVYLNEHPEIERLSLNISPDYLAHTLESDLNQFLKEIRFRPDRVYIEIIERSRHSLGKNPVLRQKLWMLKEKGFGIVLDDFGQDHSNVNLIKDFPWDMVKIDGAFVSNLLENPLDQELISFLVKLSRLQGFKLVAEFVENEEIADLLKRLGVHYLQGYFIGPPKFVPESIEIIPPLLYQVPI